MAPYANLSAGMRQLNGVYTQLFNKWHGRAGHLFQGRYKAILIQKDSHLLEVCRYGYQQQEIAAHLGLHYSSVSRIVKGER